MNFTPAPERVLIKVPTLEKITKGGIYLPDSVADKEARKQESAEIVKVGEGCFEHFSQMQVGAKVAINRYGGTWLNEEGTYRVIPWEDILGEYND